MNLAEDGQTIFRSWLHHNLTQKLTNNTISLWMLMCNRSALQRGKPPIYSVSVKTVKAGLKLLNNNKAVDIMGLPPGTLKLSCCELSEFFPTFVIDAGTISVMLKEGIHEQIFKRGDPKNRTYRGMSYLNTRTYTQCQA